MRDSTCGYIAGGNETSALHDRLKEINRSKPLYVMCRSRLRSEIACRVLTQKGYEQMATQFRKTAGNEKEACVLCTFI